MNGNSNAIAGSSAATAIPASPCDEAYASIVSVSEEHERLLDTLFNRLNDALSDPVPPMDSKGGPTPVDNPARSELHGRLLGTARRIGQQNTALREILDRLTL